MRNLKYILLPILGALAAIIAFRMAAPFEATLDRSSLGPDDPRAIFTYGTQWGQVNRIAFGALICGPFCVILALGRRSAPKVIFAGIAGAALGGLINFITDSSSDIIGIAVAQRSRGLGPLIEMVAWCILVPAGIALTIVLTQGITQQRIKRAIFAVRVAAVASFFVQISGSMLAMPDAENETTMRSQIPVWRLVEIAVGIALGITMAVADERIRVGTLRLVHGRNEYTDWSLDYPVSRIGSAEGCEIMVRGFRGVEPVHALISRQGDGFILEAKAPTTVNGQSVTQVRLNSKDVIKIGDAQLVFIAGGTVAWSATPILQQPVQTVQPIQPIQPVQPVQPVPAGQPIYTAVAPGVKILQDGFGRQIPLAPGRYGVGKESTNAFFLNDPQVSDKHAEFIVTPTTITVMDLGSATGTRLNGVPLTHPQSLNPGDVVEFGVSRFSFLG